ncbi:DNA-directed RNA polymerase II core subunit rpb9 [Boothiomyces sp. JEL0838]|nr:DNA-directed RNA polymerase II core subunit rpb9 [Boothiomyces sp. JEL0838]
MASVLFCSECNNMLYPKEDRQNRHLLFACRNCDHQEDATQFTVFKHVITHTPLEQSSAMVDLSGDPTFPRSNKPCPICGHPESIFFQSRSKGKDATMKLYFACCNRECKHRWEESNGSN